MPVSLKRYIPFRVLLLLVQKAYRIKIVISLMSGHFFIATHKSGLTLDTELNPVCHLLALLEGYHILHVFRIRVKLRLFRKPQKNIKKYK